MSLQSLSLQVLVPPSLLSRRFNCPKEGLPFLDSFSRTLSVAGRASRKCNSQERLHRQRPLVLAYKEQKNGDYEDERTVVVSEENQSPREEGIASTKEDTATNGKLPSFQDGVNWFCTSMIVFVTLVDFSPLGPLLRSNPEQAPWLLAAVQWVLFVLPTLNYCRTEAFDLRRVLLVRWCTVKEALAATSLGASLWCLVSAAIAARATLEAVPDASPFSSLLASGPGTSPIPLLLSAALLPATAEELLFRGFLLTALQAKLGKIDSVAVSGALFGIFHLSLPQFFPTTVLGLAVGAAAIASGSILPPILLHTAHNGAAILYGSLSDSSSGPPLWFAVVGSLGCLLSICPFVRSERR